VTLIFAGVSAVYSSTGTSPNALLLNGNTTFTTVGGSTITLIHSGSQWYEVSRMLV
jgi:hypothetical protein